MPVYTVHNLPHRAQVMTTFQNESPLKIRQGTVFHLELIQTLYAQNDRENCVDFYNSVFPGEAKMCLGFMSFRASSASLKQKNYHNSPNMQPILTLFQVLFNFAKRHLLTIVSK